jgi:hypothetical protein
MGVTAFFSCKLAYMGYNYYRYERPTKLETSARIQAEVDELEKEGFWDCHYYLFDYKLYYLRFVWCYFCAFIVVVCLQNMIAGVLKKYRATSVYKFIRSLQLHRPLIMYPLLFCAGAVFETAKIYWRPGGHNFYDTWRRRRLGYCCSYCCCCIVSLL